MPHPDRPYSRRNISQEDKAIQEKLEKLLEDRLPRIHQAITEEFGRAVMSCADIWYIDELIRGIAESAAYEASGAIGHARFVEARQASANMLGAALAGVQLGSGSSVTEKEGT